MGTYYQRRFIRRLVVIVFANTALTDNSVHADILYFAVVLIFCKCDICEMNFYFNFNIHAWAQSDQVKCTSKLSRFFVLLSSSLQILCSSHNAKLFQASDAAMSGLAQN